MHIRECTFKRKASGVAVTFFLTEIPNNFDLAGPVRDACKHLLEGGTAKHQEHVQCLLGTPKTPDWMNGVLTVTVERDGDQYPTEVRFTGLADNAQIRRLVETLVTEAGVRMRPSQLDLIDPKTEESSAQAEIPIPTGNLYGDSNGQDDQQKKTRRKTNGEKTTGKKKSSSKKRTAAAGRGQAPAGSKRRSPPAPV